MRIVVFPRQFAIFACRPQGIRPLVKSWKTPLRRLRARGGAKNASEGRRAVFDGSVRPGEAQRHQVEDGVVPNRRVKGSQGDGDYNRAALRASTSAQ